MNQSEMDKRLIEIMDSVWYRPSITLSKSEEYQALPQPEIEYLHCRYCDCNVEVAPTCSQCGAPLKNPACDAPIGYVTMSNPWRTV